jgi:hypothetical protein
LNQLTAPSLYNLLPVFEDNHYKMTTKGSCLCGEIEFQFTGMYTCDPRRWKMGVLIMNTRKGDADDVNALCHCLDCQKVGVSSCVHKGEAWTDLEGSGREAPSPPTPLSNGRISK